MSNDREMLEKILGGKIEPSNARDVPGVMVVDGQQVVYFSDDGKSNPRKQFDNITCFSEPPNAVRGGVNERGCKITPPSGPIFHAISYHGDLDGWRKDIEAGAIGLGLLLAHIKGDQFVISDGRSIPLSDCKIEFC
ncbi:hypothetical protein PUATCC27989T_01480 [Phytobacter ursingii]|uniref:Uncharacterized protein n=1 Tax=Phytobacter ursingii TaxID=1972431 RepID=A0AB35RMI0_9ENTR|nr:MULTISPECIES: hypothetical protein [Enterobacteriaceae]MDV2863328.1 hypothetical protein [Phytobacter ursingii]GJL36563.1 hypothetical protein TUM17576_33830 [Enterobacter hormaechei]VTP13635.1 hypothetical protein PUATCC27989T_01480 [Phytobacter ursingii]